MSCQRIEPDFERIRTVVARSGLPDRVPTAEVGIDIEIIEQFMGRPVDLPTYASFFAEAGYDYVLLQVRGQPLADSFQVRIAEGQLALHGPEASVSTFGTAVIHDEQSFEAYPWIGPQDVYYGDVDRVRDHLPDGMRLIVNCGPIFQFFFRAMGVEAMSIAMIESPDLLNAIAEKVGPLCVSIVEAIAQREWVGGIWYGDDIAYTTGLLVPPDFLRTYLFGYMRQIGQICQRYDKLYLFHSDGDLGEVMEDVIDTGVQGVHPNEPTSVDIVRLKQQYGDRLSFIGGMDVDLMSRGRPEEIVLAVRRLIDTLGPDGGYIVGGGNSIVKHVSLENYKALISTVKRYGDIYRRDSRHERLEPVQTRGKSGTGYRRRTKSRL